MNQQEETLLRIKDKLSRRGGPLICELCGGTSWDVGKTVSLSIQDPAQPNTFVLGGLVLPLTFMTCKSCGNTKFLNLIVLGVMPQSQTLVEKQVNDIIEHGV